MSKRLPLLLSAAAAAGFAALLASELQAPAPHERVRPSAAADETATDEPVLPRSRPAASPDDTRETVERPLFFASRRPVPPEPPPAAIVKQEPPPVLDFSLVGTILTGTAKLALIKPDKGGPMQLELGQTVGRWLVTSIEEDRIMVRAGTVEQLVGLREFGNHAGRPTPTAPRSQPTAASAPGREIVAAAAPAPPPPSSPLRRAGGRR